MNIKATGESKLNSSPVCQSDSRKLGQLVVVYYITMGNKRIDGL